MANACKTISSYQPKYESINLVWPNTNSNTDYWYRCQGQINTVLCLPTRCCSVLCSSEKFYYWGQCSRALEKVGTFWGGNDRTVIWRLLTTFWLFINSITDYKDFKNAHGNQIRPWGYFFFMLNSTEHEILNAQSIKIPWNSVFFRLR